jgi:serine/threonine protein kinase
MGTVYMAQQEKPVKRRVALKIIKQGMDTKQVVARFEAERQALSMMDHTHIAKVLDVGATAQGRPFFVMELIKGLPITRYCDDKNLNIKQRLQLFKSVCNAVQHAHQRGIIHRDLKPSNILVADYDGKPVPKIIDFGLAKALHQQLTDKTMFTQLGQVVGTLEYMSPEQSSMNQLEVDTRTDIYSLGVLLYELLTGTVPFDKKRMRSVALDQVLKIIREEDPPKPSLRLSTVESSTEAASHRGVEAKRLGQMLRGDLDWIVMKAVEKDRSRRYETANGLAMDVQRYLDGEPVLAAPPSTVYRLRKFVRRNRAAVIAGSLVMAALVVGVLGTSIGLVRALDAGNRAHSQTQIAVKAVEAERTAKQQALASAKQVEARAKQAKIEKENAKVSQLAAEYSQYVSDIQYGDIHIDQKSTRQARSILKAAPAAFRNWEWAFLANQAWRQFPSIDMASEYNASANVVASKFWSRGSVRVIQEIIPGGIAGAHKGAFTRDGKSVVLSLSDGRVGKFSLSDGKHISDFPTSSGNILGVATSPDGKKLGGFVFSGGAFVWDIESKELIVSHPDDFTVSAF